MSDSEAALVEVRKLREVEGVTKTSEANLAPPLCGRRATLPAHVSASTLREGPLMALLAACCVLRERRVAARSEKVAKGRSEGLEKVTRRATSFSRPMASPQSSSLPSTLPLELSLRLSMRIKGVGSHVARSLAAWCHVHAIGDCCSTRLSGRVQVAEAT